MAGTNRAEGASSGKYTIKALHEKSFMDIIDTLIGDNYNYFTEAQFEVAPEDVHKKVQIAIKSIPMDKGDARSAIEDIQEALTRDHQMHSVKMSNGKQLDVPLPSTKQTKAGKDVYQVCRISIKQPSAKGSGGGADLTRISESAQCYYLALRFNHPNFNKGDIGCGCDTIFGLTDFQEVQKNGWVLTDASPEEVAAISLEWRDSCCRGANAIFNELNKGQNTGGHSYKFVRGDREYDDGIIKNAFLSVKKLHADQGGTDFSSEDKWNPADIWIVDTNAAADIKSEITSPASLGKLNTSLQDLFNKKVLMGVSLKKIVGSPNISIKNEIGKAKIKDKQLKKIEVVFDNKKNYSDESKRYPMDVYFYYGTGANDRFQARNFGGSSTSPKPSWQMELKGQFANQGRIGGGVVFNVMKRMKPSIVPNFWPSQASNLKIWNEAGKVGKPKDATGEKFLKDIVKLLKDNNASGLNGMSDEDIKATIMTQDQSYRYSKMIGLRLVEFIKGHARKDEIINEWLAYASSESDDSGVYYKMQ